MNDNRFTAETRTKTMRSPKTIAAGDTPQIASMKACASRLFLSCALIALLPLSAPADNAIDRPFRDKWAVVIGISKFVKPELDLNYADKDAVSFYNYLTNSGNFARDHIKLLVNEKASRRAILSTLGSSWLSRMAGPEDLVVVYISSHGSPPEPEMQGVNYLLASDTDSDDLYSSGIDMQDLGRLLKAKVHSNRVVIFVDTCYSSAGVSGGKGLVRSANADAEKLGQDSGQIIIASSLPNQVSWESAKLPNSVFTSCLIDALKSKGETTTLSDAFNSLKNQVQNTVRQERGEQQTPVMKSPFSETSLSLAAKATDPQPVPADEFESSASNKNRSTVDSTSKGTSATSQTASTSAGSVLSERVALLPFEEGDDMGLDVPDYDGMAPLLEELVRLRLASAIQNRLLSPYEVGGAIAKTNLGSIWTNESRMALGKACRANYLVKVRIKKEHFNQDGSLEFGVSICVASGQTGDYIWTGGNKADSAKCAGDSAAQQNYLKTVILPTFARYISRAILATVCPK